MDLGAVVRDDRENGSEEIVRGIGFEDNLCFWNLMSQYWCGCKGLLECFEVFPGLWSEVPNNSFSSNMHEWNCDIRVVKNESPVKICESRKGLNVLDFSWFRPFLDGLDLVIGHGETSQR